MLATFAVSNLLDGPVAAAGDLPGSLRQAIFDANANPGADTVSFDAGVFTGGSKSLIRLNGTELEIVEAISIDGSTGTDVVITADADANDVNVSGTDITDVAASLAADGTSLDDNSRVLNFSNTTGGLTLNNLTITGGRTTGVMGDDGGGIRFASSGTLTLDHSTVSGNSTAGSGADGGGIYTITGSLAMTSSTVSGNSAEGNNADGGGIFTVTGDVTLTNSTVSGNSVKGNNAGGGGIFTVTGDVTLTNSTVSGNSSSSHGGGILVLNSGTGPNFSVENSIVADNTAVVNGPDLVPDTNSILTINYSLIGVADGLTISGDIGNLKGIAAMPLDPVLGPLKHNGGSTWTHALLPGSAAIDAGNPSAMAGLADVPEFDQRGVGFGRVNNSRIDIGAFEVLAVDSADFDSDADIDGSDFLTWQRGLGTPAPAAAKSDGDADNDLDVDGDDLLVWQNQFGLSTPLVAIPPGASTSGESSALFAIELAEPTLAVHLIDAAMAVIQLESETVSDIEPTLNYDDEAFEVAFQIGRNSNTIDARLSRSTTDLITSSNTNHADTDGEAAWLSTELLDRVFG